ncbi:hypothetical protein [Phyllobacterium zundukense]|uniref:Uncharacterized protein n=1 Tax=Phyllobacterium zundukense TaxID=1867719 RepID=A0A2N9W055_9HYPH|nr:hypothetical protein [Phyllobacterium zundukense]ATU90636.1 hypothetical protein BLM14_02410 [Phyllobacterium zundukense]PIO45123.1 hypothetical protein B5P45_08750 [Phyllobacterium zundukense]
MIDRNNITNRTEIKLDAPVSNVADKLTILTERDGKRQRKIYRFVDGAWEKDDAKFGFRWSFEQHEINSLDDLERVVKVASQSSTKTVIRGEPSAVARIAQNEQGFVLRRKEMCFDPAPRRWAMIDIDDFSMPGYNVAREPEKAIAALVREHFPAEFQDTKIAWQLSSSAGLKDPDMVKVHLWVWLSRPMHDDEMKAWCRMRGFPADMKVFDSIQLHYIADPQLIGAPDPVAQRWGRLEGSNDEVKVPHIDVEQIKADLHARGENLGDVVPGKDVAEILSKAGDGENGYGYHAPIRDAIMLAIRTTHPAKYEQMRGNLKTQIREAVLVAPRGGHHTLDYVKQAISDRSLDSSIDGAIRRENAQIMEVSPLPILMPFENAQAVFAAAFADFERFL